MKKTILTQERHLCHIHFYLIAAALSLFFLSGCKDDNITPCGCEHILDWAPDTCSFSLSEYNSLKQVKDYLYQHDSTIVSHAGDTVQKNRYMNHMPLILFEKTGMLTRNVSSSWGTKTTISIIMNMGRHGCGGMKPFC